MREYFHSVADAKFSFYQNRDDFKVFELVHKEFDGSGNFLILEVQKIDLTTWEMVEIVASYLRIPPQKVGYAGLKDKHATTTQFISVQKMYEKEISRFSHPNISILQTFRDKNSLRLGDLGANRFSINLYKVDNILAGRIQKCATKILKYGLPNYFGYQRFGHDESSIAQAKELVAGELFVKDGKLKSFLYSIYQSELFNKWLLHRVLDSKAKGFETLELLRGDILAHSRHYNLEKSAKPMEICGLLCGRDLLRAKHEAREIERLYDDEFFAQKGSLRDALVEPKDLQTKYFADQSVLNISFTMPRGSYATVFLESIAGKNYSAQMVKNKNHSAINSL